MLLQKKSDLMVAFVNPGPVSPNLIRYFNGLSRWQDVSRKEVSAINVNDKKNAKYIIMAII